MLIELGRRLMDASQRHEKQENEERFTHAAVVYGVQDNHSTPEYSEQTPPIRFTRNGISR